MIISRTPFRLSFLGGGTDYPAWYTEHGGAVLGTTINKYCYLNVRYLPPFFEHRYNVVWSRIERRVTLDEIEHPAAREILRYMNITRGLEIHHDGDLPARSGTGSSSSFTIGLLNALYALEGTMASKQQLMTEGIHIEQDILKENVGSQDQVFAAYGGFNQILFHQSGEISVIPITIGHERIKELDAHLMLFFTGIRRTASEVVASYSDNFNARRRQLRVLQDLVEEGVNVLNSGKDLHEFGELLHEGWQMKRGISDAISNSTVDSMYDAARSAGAVGGKLSGAGGGGFMLLFVPPERQARVLEAFKHLVHVPFQFESAGSQIIFCEQEEDYEAAERVRVGQNITPFRELRDLKRTAGDSA